MLSVLLCSALAKKKSCVFVCFFLFFVFCFFVFCFFVFCFFVLYWGKDFARTKAACLVEVCVCAFKKTRGLGACGGGSASWNKGGLVE